MKFTGRSTQELIRQRDERLALTTRPLVGKDDAGNKQAIREITEELGRRGARQR